MREVARRAGVSPMTVSLALRDSAQVSASTRERVRRIAAELGYQPDPALSALAGYMRQHRHRPRGYHVYAYVHPYGPLESLLASDLQCDYFLGAVEAGRSLGIHIEPYPFDSNASLEDTLRIIYHRGIRGVLLAIVPARVGNVFEVKTDWSRFTVISLGDSERPPLFHEVLTDSFRNAMTAVQRLLKLGYQRPGLVLTEDLNRRTAGKWTAAFLYRQFRDIPPANRVPPLVCECPADLLQAWYHEYRPDCLLTQVFKPAAVPTLLGVSPDSHPPFCAMLAVGEKERKSIPGIYTRARAIGAAAVRLLTDEIRAEQRGPPPHPRLLLLPGEWTDGKTRAVTNECPGGEILTRLHGEGRDLPAPSETSSAGDDRADTASTQRAERSTI